MAEIISTVGSHASRHYATLPLWHTARQLVHTDLVADGDTEHAKCYDDGVAIGGAGFDVNGWTTDADNRVIVRAASGQRHDGTTRVGDATGNGAWLTTVGVGSGGPVINLRQSFTEIDGLRIFHDVGTERAGIQLTSQGTGNTSTATRCLGHGTGLSGRCSVGIFSGSGLQELTAVGCVAVGGGFVVNAFSSADLSLRAVNCTAIDCDTSFIGAQGGGGTAAFKIINCISINPTTAHITIALGLVTQTGKANIQDDSGAAGTLPDDDPSFPSFTDVEVIFEEDNPSPAQRLILRRKDHDDVETLVSQFCLAFENGAPDSDTEQFGDINGLAIPAIRHIGAFVPVEAGPHVMLMNL